jgi:hypothetical protein
VTKVDFRYFDNDIANQSFVLYEIDQQPFGTPSTNGTLGDSMSASTGQVGYGVASITPTGGDQVLLDAARHARGKPLRFFGVCPRRLVGRIDPYLPDAVERYRLARSGRGRYAGEERRQQQRDHSPPHFASSLSAARSTA